MHVLRWHTGVDAFTGKRTQRQETFHGTAKAARKRLAECIASAEPSSSMSLGALLDLWEREARVRADTMQRYDFALRHLPPALRAVQADAVTSPMIAELYHRLLAEGVGRQTIRKLATALSSAFRHGIEWGVVDRNPCRGVRPPAIERRDYVIPTREQLVAMLEAADAMPGAAGIWLRLALSTGARRGEVLALRWSDLDLDRGRLRITSSMRHNRERGDTKTAAAVRTVLLDEDTVTALRSWHARAGERALSVGAGLGPDSYVVSDDEASAVPWRPELATKRLRRLSAAAGCPGARLHDVRHAHVTMLLDLGVSDHAIAERVGHVRASFTRDFYGHVSPGAAAAAAVAFGRHMRSGTN